MFLRSWFFNEADAPFIVSGLLVCAGIYLQMSGMSAPQLREYGRKEIFAIYGPAFLDRLSTCLVQRRVLDEPLYHVLVLTARVLDIAEYHPHFLRSGTLRALRKAVDRQSTVGRDDDDLRCMCLVEVLEISL